MSERNDKPLGEASLGEVLFEFRQIGVQMRVAALHVDTGTEITLMAPAASPRAQVQQVAMAKLRRRLQMEGYL